MSKVLVKAVVDYADEFDCEAIKVFDSKEDWENYLNQVKVILKDKCSVEYFGTNEYLEFCSIEELSNQVELIEVSDDVANFIENNLKEFGTGHCAIFKMFDICD